jgi:NhaP-type Na+/H+ or K+/H+ antiporter
VIVGTVLTAALVKYTFPYDWNWVESLLFGAMFSATDPVAVVAVLKEVTADLHSCSLDVMNIFGWMPRACC